MMIAAPTSLSKNVEDGGNFSADSPPSLNSDDEQLDDAPFLSHQLSDDHESFSEKFLRNILTHDYQNLMPRRREKFVEITKTVTVTEIVNGAPDKHPSSCEVKVTNVSPAGPHPVNVSIKHLHEKWHSCEELDRSDNGEDLGKGTVIRIQETHKPFNCTQKKHQTNKFVYEDVINTKMESSTKSRQPPSANSTLFNRSSDNIIDLEFRHPILRETSEKKSERTEQKANGNNGTRRRFADLRKRVSTTTKTSVTETENVTTTRRSSSAHSTHSKRSSAKPEVHTLYYRKFVDEETKGADDDSSDSGSVIIYRDAVTRRSRSADPLQNSSPTMSPIAPPRKRLGREESLHYYRDDDEVIQEQSSTEKSRRVTVKSPEPGNTSVSMNDNVEGRNLTAGITSISMNDSCTDTSYESRFSTIPRARSSPPGNHRVNHIQVNVIGPIRVSEPESRHPVVGSVGEDVTMDIYIERRRSGSNPRRDSHVSFETLEAPPKPPRRSKYDEHIRIGDPIATSTPMTTIERKQTREERVSTESGQSSRKSTRSSRPPDINIIECETFLKETRSPARTPATPIVVINQTPSSRRSSQDLLGEPGQRRRKSTVTDIDWYAAFNMKDPSSPTKIARPSFASHNEERKASRDLRRRASDSSMIGIPPADIDLNQIFLCTVPPEIKKDEKCQCNACRLIRMSEAERAVRIERSGRSRQSRSFTRTTEFETRSSTLPSRHRTAPVDIELEDIFNPKPFSHPSANSKPPTPPNRRRHPPSASVAHSQSSFVDESPSQHFVTTTIDRNQVTPVTTTTTNMRESGPLLHENSHNQLLSSSDNWVAQMMNDASEWENNVSSRKSSILSTSSTSARKASVARRISVDELTKPEKRKSRQAVPLPPSDVSIDDIFTALTPRKEEVQSERKTFIVTRKQRAQDVDAIDFEKDRETPIAPPRSGKRKSDATENQPEITLELDVEKHEIDSSKVSTSTINLNDESMETRNTNDSKDSFDDEVNPRNQRLVVEIPFSEPRVTSTATIQLESSDVAGENSENKRPVISMRSKSEIAKKEKDAQRSGFVIIPHSKEHILDESNISMDDVFNTTPHDQCRVPDIDADSSKHTSSDSREVSTVTINLDNVFPTEEPKLVAKDNCEIEAEEERIGKRIKQFERTTGEQEISKNSEPTEDEMPDEKDHRTSAVSIDLDKVFVQGTAKKPENDEFDEKIKRGIAEFERSKQEKEVQRSGVAETSHSSKHIFDESNISMDDVFNTSQKYKSDEKLSTPERTVEPEVSTATMNLDNIIFASGIATREKNTDVLEEEERIQKRVEEFKKTTENLEIQKEVVLTKEEGDNSDVKDHKASAVNIDLDDVFIQRSSKHPENDEDDEKIRRGIAEFERTKQEKEAQRSTVIETQYSSKDMFNESDISLDVVFNTSQKDKSDEKLSSPERTVEPEVSTATVNLDNMVALSKERRKENNETQEEEEQIQKRVEEFKESTEEQKIQKSIELTKEECTSDEKELKTYSGSIDLDKVFIQGSSKKPRNDESDERINRGIAEFERTKQEKEAQRSVVVETSPSNKHISDESSISMDEIFSRSQDNKSTSNFEKSGSIPIIVLPGEEKEVASASINLNGVFLEGKQKTSTDYGREKVNKVQENSGSYSTRHAMDGASISLDDIFNTSSTSQKTETDKIDNSQEFPQLSKPVLKSSISLDDLFNNTSGIEKTTSEKTTTTTTTRTETTTDTYSKRSTSTLVDRFGYETATPPAISIAAISFDQPSSSSPQAFPRSKHQNLSSLTVPGKWNESMMSNTSTISLDDSFNNSFSKSNTSQVYEPRMRKPLTLPVDNWIDNLVSEATNEATKEAPKTPKSDTLNYFRSPTRISQEIKYEWVADMIGDIDRKNKGGHQSEEEHLQKHDSTWVSSVVYRPTLETSAYTLRSSQLNTDCKMEIDLENVFDECLMGKKKDDEHCECSACRLTEQELEEIKKRKIELENMTSEQKIIISEPSDRRKSVDFSNPSQISLNEVFSPEVPLRIETEHAPAPSTSSPPLESTRIYYLSPKVSETVTTTHQWKDAGIPMDEIFSPVSSTADGNRRFSNFYEDRSGWDTIGSEDSGVMSGGDRGRRRSTRITDQVIDEAFQGIFDSQPSTSTAHPKPVRTETHYDDYYITSLQQEDLDATDSEVDGENLDVSTFVDDILGKSMDEAAFLSSTKSLREHTDTSIDRKKSGEKVHSYYRNRTDTSIDKRSKPEVITEDLETSELQDEIMKLVFVEPSVSKSDSSANIKASQNKSTTKPCDEELLEIEIKSEYFLIKGSYSLLIPKSDPLGKMLQKLREQNDSLATLDFSLTRKLKKLLVNCIREKAGSLDMVSMSSQYEGLSSRGQSLIESIDHASATFLKMNVDKYEPTRNPNGVVNFCTAENNICTPLLEDRFKHLELFFPNIEHLVRYPPAGGWPETRRVLVKYFKEFMGAGVTIDELVLTASTRTGYDVTSYCLFEQDDILLTNGPIYTGTISNVQEKAQCQVVCVETDLSNPRLDVKMYEAELNRQIALENTVSGVIIVNPHNPLGVTFPPEQVISLCNWASSKNLRVVIDEVFANSVFDKLNSKFRPFLSYRHRLHRPDSVAWLWSVSKDFGLPGLKFAVIHTTNEGLCQAATKLQMYYPCSPFVQDFAVNLLSDSEWLREFHREVNKRISIHYRYTSDNLKRLEIPFIPAQAGIFVFADFSKHLTSLDSVGELALFERLAEAGVMLTPGVHQKCHVFGWFRIVFACTKEELEEGFRRLYIHLGSQLQPVGTVEY